MIILPFLGVLVYLIARGKTMQERTMEEFAAREKAQRAYIQEVSSTGASTAEELTKLAALRDQGVLTQDEFDSQKAALLA